MEDKNNKIKILHINKKDIIVHDSKSFFVDKLKNITPETKTIKVPMVFDGEKIVSKEIVCDIVSPLVRGDKVTIFKKRRRKGYTKCNGFRKDLTQLKIQGGNK